MNLPEITNLPTGRDVINYFAGINKAPQASSRKATSSKAIVMEWADDENITGDLYPAMSVRKKRGRKNFTMPQGTDLTQNVTAFTHNNMWLFIYDGKLYAEYPSGETATQISGNDDEFSSSSYLVSMGAYVIVFPEGYYVNTADIAAENTTVEKGYIYSAFDGTVSYDYCDEYGNLIEIDESSDSLPTANSDGKWDNGYRWYDQKNKVLKIYSESQGQWVTQTGDSHYRVKANGIADAFCEGDMVSVDFSTSATANRLVVMENYREMLVGERYVSLVHNDATSAANDYIVINVSGSFFGQTNTTPRLSFTRKFPTIDYVFECNNRLWGCRYGQNADGVFVNEIYACKQGDFKNWFCYRGLTDDSYAVSCGTQGAFTGGCVYNGYPLFFKENCVYKIYGAYPAAYQLDMDAITGVAEGCGKSLVTVKETLLYQGRDGIYSYTGGVPSKISAELYDDGRCTTLDDIIIKLKDGIENTTGSKKQELTAEAVIFSAVKTARAKNSIDPSAYDSVLGTVAGVSDGKYYIDKISSTRVLDDEYNFVFERYVYEIDKDIWHRESVGDKVLETCTYNGKGYYITETFGSSCLETYSTENGLTDAEETVAWMAESGEIGTNDPDHKYISRIDFRVRMDVGARAFIYIQYDSVGDWNHIATIQQNNLNTISLPVRIRRCDHCRIRIEGTGNATIYNITKTVEQGSEL